jgi:hypothetical protein
MWLKIMKYMGEKNLPNAEKFKYMWINTGDYPFNCTAAGSISYPSNVYMFNPLVPQLSVPYVRPGI